MAPKAKAGGKTADKSKDGGAKGKNKNDGDSGGGKIKSAQQINPRHILVW